MGSGPFLLTLFLFFPFLPSSYQVLCQSMYSLLVVRDSSQLSAGILWDPLLLKMYPWCKSRDILWVHLLLCHLIISSKIVFNVSSILVQDEKPIIRLWWKTQVGLWKGSSRLVKALRVEDSISPLYLIAWNLGNFHFLAFSLSQILPLDLLFLLWAAEKCLFDLSSQAHLKKKKEQENEKKRWLGEKEEMPKT